MKDFSNKMKKLFFPEPDKAALWEIDLLNIRTIYYVSLVVGIVQTIVLVMFCFTHLDEMGQTEVTVSILSVFFSILLCLAGFFGAGFIRRRVDIAEHHIGINLFVGAFFSLLIIWGMLASIQTFIDGKQIITFFITETAAVLFVRLKPSVTALIILTSYTVFYVALELWVKSGTINGYNYMMMALLSVAGAVFNYRITLGYIEQKNKASELNESLEVIANHDVLTRLKNRYALNQVIPGYVDMDICLAMMDIDGFKTINDTYGHRTGDRVLREFSDILQKHFGHDGVYRYGGDEFLVISLGCDAEEMVGIMEEVNKEFGEMRIDDIDMTFSCSYGMKSGRPQRTSDFLEMVISADNTLYESKGAKKR